VPAGIEFPAYRRELRILTVEPVLVAISRIAICQECRAGRNVNGYNGTSGVVIE